MDKRDPSIPDEHYVPRTGQWLPQDRRHHVAWLKRTTEHVAKNPRKLHPVLVEFQQLVENDTRLWMLFNCMFSEIPHKQPYLHDPMEKPQVRNFTHMLEILNHLLVTPPDWSHIGDVTGLVGCPINAILEWPMGTRSGFAVFLDPAVNKMFKKVLNVWGEFLMSPASAAVLAEDDASWFGAEGQKELTKVANNGVTSHSLSTMFICDPSLKHHGFKSWDDFFTRHFKEGMRPIASPEDDNVIANACESKTYKVAHNVHSRDKFWIKGQPYSVVDMLARDPLAEQFVGGTIYQAFLSALSYHRWHSPVSGTIKKAYVVDGTYFSEPPYDDFAPGQGANPDGETASQEYLAAVATRGIIFIEADNPKIGLMAVVPVGMVEVSTCDITVKQGQKVKKGDELGMFHFGGSTHCLLFRKGVDVKGFPKPGQEHNVPVRSKLAEVV